MEVNTIVSYGNLLKVNYSDGTNALAYPTNGGLWIVNGGGTSGGETTGGTPPSGTELMWPFPLGDETSGYGNRTDPVTGQYRLHDGIDFGEALDSPIHAAAAGKVSAITTDVNTGYGNACWLQHTQFGGKTTTTFYGHMHHPPTVSLNENVAYGHVIGYVDSTGESTGNHLHFGTWDGTAYADTINPNTYMSNYGGVVSTW